MSWLRTALRYERRRRRLAVIKLVLAKGNGMCCRFTESLIIYVLIILVLLDLYCTLPGTAALFYAVLYSSYVARPTYVPRQCLVYCLLTYFSTHFVVLVIESNLFLLFSLSQVTVWS